MDRDLFPNGDANAPQSKFKHANPRRIELALQQELNDVARRTLMDLTVKKQAQMSQPLEEPLKTARKLKPEFVPQKVRRERKSHPIFLPESATTIPTELPAKVMNVPPYNPLEKNVAPPPANQTKKLPYSKEETTTAAEMKKPKISAVGVNPPRDSAKVDGLKVIMEGKKVTASENEGDIKEVLQANDVMDSTTKLETSGDDVVPETKSSLPETEKLIKPMIAAYAGTTGKVVYGARERPPPRPRSKMSGRKTPKHTLAGSSDVTFTPSSLRSAYIDLPDDTKYSLYTESMVGSEYAKKAGVKMARPEDEDDRSSTASSVDKCQPVYFEQRKYFSTGIKSVKELMEEAKSIASSSHVPKPPAISKRGSNVSKKAPTHVPVKKKKSTLSEKPVTKKSEERSVDEIIASLRTMSEGGTQSEADKKLQEIMERVMTRTSTVLGEIDDEPVAPQETIDEVPEPEDDQQPQVETPVPESVQQDDVSEGRVSMEPVTQPEEEADETEQFDLQVEPPVDEQADEEDIDEQMSFAKSTHTSVAASVTEEPILDLKWAYDALLAPSDVYYEDIISIDGRPKPLQQADSPQKKSDDVDITPLLSTWTPASHTSEQPALNKNVHHFCTVREGAELPKALMHVGRKYHAPSQYISVTGVTNRHPAVPSTALSGVRDNQVTSIDQGVFHKGDAELAQRQSRMAQTILDEAYSMKPPSVEQHDTLEAWAARADQIIDNIDLSIEGAIMPIKTDESRLYWTPAPPKLDIAPANVQKQLFAEYRGVTLAESPMATPFENLEEVDEGEEEHETVVMDEDEEDIIPDRIFLHRWKSHEDLTELVLAKREFERKSKRTQDGTMKHSESIQTFATNDSIVSTTTDSVDTSTSVPPGPRMSVAELRQYLTQPLSQSQHSSTKQSGIPEEETGVQKALLPHLVPLRRSRSSPAMLHEDDPYLIVPHSYETAVAEIEHHRFAIYQNLKKEEYVARTAQHSAKTELVEDEFELEKEEIIQLQKKSPVKSKKPTPAELALQAGRNYVLLPPKKKKAKVVDMRRIEEIERFIRKKPRQLERSESLPKVVLPVDKALKVPVHVKQAKRASLTELDFEHFKKDNSDYFKKEDVEREQVRAIWNDWFDEVFPEPQDQHESSSEEESVHDLEEEKRKAAEKQKKAVDSINYREVSSVNLVPETEEDEIILETLHEQIDQLSAELEKADVPKAFYLSRRGALYRKIGKINLALADLDKAIEMEPMLLDAYWHRHLIYLLQGNNQQALEDVNFLLKHNRMHSGAYRSRAEIYKAQGDITMTIINYTQAIKINPKDHEAYFCRAEMYEKRNEMLLAMEDYAIATRLAPHKTEAIMRHALYYFKNENWQASINDFSELLKIEPLNAPARMYRGRAYSKLNQWNSAVEDLSAAIHLDPKNSQALYYRGCILRKCHPKKALQDFSISILLDDSEANYSALLHRGILYNAIGKPEDAIPDFEAVLKLSNDIALAHVNLGLIYMTKMENYQKAIKKFSNAIKVDPTYVRAYVCRAEAYHRIHDPKNALLDFTRAIHIRPDIPHYYMYRGQMVLELGNLELAAFCVRHASEFNVGIAASPTQVAVVQSFLKNYNKAISALQAATRSKPIPSLFVLLGKTEMKAKMYKEAAESFEKALNILRPKIAKTVILKPWQAMQVWPKEAAEVNYMIGLCYMELRNYLGAHDAFNNAVRIDSSHAEAYYQRGMARLRLKNAKGILDLNKALAINPKIFQAYLSRATFYGMHGRYSKAIMNCNEALKLQPKSVRAYLYRGALKYHIKAYTLAIKDLSKATEIDCQCALAYFNRAVCQHDSGNFNKALQDYGIVLMLGDDLMLKVLINRGLLYYERRDFQNALYDFSMAAKVDSLDPRIHHTLGLCYHKLGKLQKAVETFTVSIKRNRSFLEAYLARGNVFMDYGHLQGLYLARHDYERALHISPTFLPARINLAYSLQVEGKFQQAWNQFTMALTINENYKPALEGRAIVNLQMSATDGALQDICASIRVQPTAELYTNRGVIHQFMNDKANAMRDYQTALRIDPNYSLAYFNAANMYFHTHQFGQARQFYDKALTITPRDESALLNRAITKVMLRDSKGALVDFHLALKHSPHSAHIYFNRGNFFMSLNKFELAEKDYSHALRLQPDDSLCLKRRADVLGKLGRRDDAIADYKHAIEIQGRKQPAWRPNIAAH